MSADRLEAYFGTMPKFPDALLRPLIYRSVVLLALPALLTGCDAVVLTPAGDVAARQRDLLVISTGLMLLIIIPVIALTLLFAWRYRHSNTAARYEPEWDHSTRLELIIWAAPLLIIICLGAITWVGTHLLDPYRQIERLASGKPVAAGMEPLRVEVVALDWKWLFFYPQYGIATVNELAAPLDRPINFSITSSSVMNSFYIPALAGQIYAMPGMETKLSAVINTPGDYTGFSANYSGAGFSGMHFRFYGQSADDFGRWVNKVRGRGGSLDRDGYLNLERPTEREPVRYYSLVAPGLYHAALNMCVRTGKMCKDEMMMVDAKGGMGAAGITSIVPLEHDTFARGTAPFGVSPTFIASVCTAADPQAKPGVAQNSVSRIWPRDSAGIRGAGLSSPELPRLSTIETSDFKKSSKAKIVE